MRPHRWILVALAIGIVAAAAAAQQGPQLVATVAGNAVLVSFDLQPQTRTDMEERLSHRAPTVVMWLVELKRSALLRDRSIVRGVIRASAQRINDSDGFSVSRSVNGVITEDGVRMDRQGAFAWLTSFPPVPLFEQFQLDDHAAHRLTITAIVEGGKAPRIVTSTLARADLQWR
jgi:hypothetical protein